MALGDSITAGKIKYQMTIAAEVLMLGCNILFQHLGFGMLGRRGGVREYRVSIC